MGAEKILVIEDDRDLSEILSSALAKQSFSTIVAHDGSTGLSEARRTTPSLILLDLMLPSMDGLEVCHHLRTDEKTRHIPIIMVTAKGEEEYRVAGLNMGADDYMAKPFSTRELIARIRAILRRAKAQAPGGGGRLCVGDLEIDVDQHVVTVGQTVVHLTLTEFTLLCQLAREPGQVFSRDQLLTALWGDDCFLQEHNLDVHIHSIRKKLGDDPNQPRYIHTVRGLGYKLRGDSS